MGFIYHERQLGGLCGVHCLNNLLQGPHFGPGDLAEIGVQLDQQERQLLEEASPSPGAASSSSAGPAAAASAEDGAAGEGGAGDGAGGGGGGGGSSSSSAGPADGIGEAQCYNVDPSADGGNFSIQVLAVALQRFNLTLLPAKHPAAKQPMQDPGAATEAFLCQYRDHWFAIRQVADCWWNLNSTRQRPAMVGPFYLAAWLSQLTAEGYSIFLLQGDRMPEPIKPRDPSSPEENFHEIFDLLEKAKESGGNPLAGGGDEVDEGDAAAAARLAAELEWEPSSPGPSGLYEELVRAQNAQEGGDAGAAEWDVGFTRSLYEDMVRAQMQARQPRRPLPPQQQPQRSVAEYSMVDAGASSDRDRGRGPGGESSASGGLMQEMLRALQCPCGWTTEEVGSPVASVGAAPTDDYPPLYPSASRSSPASRHRAPPHDDERPTEAPSAQALVEMGFSEPMVRVAQELARGLAGNSALQLLLKQPGVDPEVTADGEHLGRAIQQAVLSCDTESKEAFRQRLLRAVALLSLEEAMLQAAQPHFSAEAMKSFLESVIRNRVKSWPAEYSSAAKVLVDMLASFPRCLGAGGGDGSQAAIPRQPL